MPTYTRASLHLLPLLATLTLTACPEDKVVVGNLFLEISSDAPASGSLDHLRVLLSKDGTHHPAVPTEAAFNPDITGRDLTSKSFLMSVPYDGSTFGAGDDVVVNITGWVGAAPATRFEGRLDLDTATIVKVHLSALPAACDGDGDGFLDCTVAGCCAEGSVFGDCDGANATANPWAVEAECEPCSDTVDQDCSGSDQACVDTDDDGIADCAETCGQNDPASGPGKLEICDDKDNDCDLAVDENLSFSYGGRVLDKGEACGLGLCAGGTVECAPGGGMRCSNDNKRLAKEDCATPGDDNCNGIINEGCSTNDFDGDGATTPADCNDFDAGIYPGRLGEPCCAPSAQGTPAEAACDLNCDGNVAFCEAGDNDGDGVTVAEGDCNDNDATVAPGRPERCGDGVDQDCSAGDLVCSTVIDGDGDGWPSGVDCNDGDASVAPNKPELCNGKDDDCDNITDEGDPGGGAECGTTEVGECAFGALRCQNSVDVVGQIVCVGAIEAAAADVCDGKDEDCDGETDEDFDYLGRKIGESCDGVGACGQGVVECVPGVTNLATCSTNPNGSASAATTEVCDALDNDCDGETNEALTNVADSDCSALGVCGANREAIVASCTPEGTWLCDYAAVPGYEATEASCDARDNDCDGETNEGLVFVDGIGRERLFGQGCDGDDSDQCESGIVGCHPSDPTRTACNETGAAQEELCDGVDNDCDGDTDEDFRDTPSNDTRLAGALLAADNGRFLGDSCGTGACGGGTVICGSTTSLKCSTDPRTPAAPSAPTDVCDGVDNDCDGATDEAYIAGGTVKLQGALLAADNGKAKGASCGSGECAGGTVICGSTTTLACSTDVNGQTTQGGQTVTRRDTCNGKDDNCNGVTDDDFVATTGANRKPLAGAAYASDNGKIKGATCGIGECIRNPTGGGSTPGVVQCNVEGTALVCSSDGRATTDVCDNLDNDCDGTDDDPFRSVGGTTLQGAKLASDNGKIKGATCGTGTCANGRVICAASKTALVCDSDSRATTDVCDDIDNDCDGTRDEGFFYDQAAVGASCDGIGGCGAGTVVCANATAATCSTNPDGNASQVSDETCDNIDNDCDNQTDEDIAAVPTTCGVGVCAGNTGMSSCTNGAMSDTCNPLAGSSAETCDGLDNDCDGTADDGFANHDGDLFGDACDPDDDNDGILDGVDGCPRGDIGWPPSLATDWDADGCRDAGEDTDDDNDGVLDATDKCDPDDIDRDGDDTDDSDKGWVSSQWSDQQQTVPGTDYDTDGCRDAGEDTDDDNDGRLDTGDLCDPDNEVGDGVRASARNWVSADLAGDLPGTDYDLDGCKDDDAEDSDDDHDGIADGDDDCDPDAANGVLASERDWVSTELDPGDAALPGSDFDQDGCRDLSGEDRDDDNDALGDEADECDPDVAVGDKTERLSEKNWVSAMTAPDQPTVPGTDYDGDGCMDTDGDDAGSAEEDDDDDNDLQIDSADLCDPDAGDARGATLSDLSWTTDFGAGNPGVDYDNDGCRDAGEDTDDDSDGVVDGTDRCDPDAGTSPDTGAVASQKSWTSNTTTDWDGDGCVDTHTEDGDDDNDGRIDADDACDPASGTVSSERGTPLGSFVSVNSQGANNEFADYDHDGCKDDDDEDDDDDNDKRSDATDKCDPDALPAPDDALQSQRGPPVGLFDSTVLAQDNDADGCLDNSSEDPDRDNDGVADNGNPDADDPCTTGETDGCDDNCVLVANAAQTDTDADGRGDSCDICPVYERMPFEVCGDCIDNDCDGSTDEGAVGECVQRRMLVVDSNGDALSPGYALPYTFDHENLVDGMKSTASGDDVRIWYKDPDIECSDDDASVCWREIDRVVDPNSAWDSASGTTLWFALQDRVASDATNTDYELFYGVPGTTPLEDEAMVFKMADFFDRDVTPEDPITGWTQSTDTLGNLIINASSEMQMVYAANGAFAPMATKTFGAIDSGVWELRIGMDFARNTENDWAIGMQLGNALGTGTPVEYPTTGVGPSIAWGGGTSLGGLAVTTLATEIGRVFTSRGTFNTTNELRLTVDLDANTYSVAGTGVTASGVAFSDSTVTSLNTLRFFGSGVGMGFTKKAWDHVILRPVVTGKAPSVYEGMAEPTGTGSQCTLTGTGPRVRYYLSETGTSNTADDALDQHDLTRTTEATSPSWTDFFGNGGLSFAIDATNDGRLQSAFFNGTEQSANLAGLDRTKVVTVELVLLNQDASDADDPNHVLSLDNENGTPVVRLSLDGTTVSATLLFSSNDDGANMQKVVKTWAVPSLPHARRSVLHLVVDTEAQEPIKLYLNGVLRSGMQEGTLSAGRGLHLIDDESNANSAVLTLGNDHDFDDAMYGTLFYAAIYKSAFDASTLEQNTRILLRNDDAP